MGIVSGRTVAWKRVIGSVIGERLGVEQTGVFAANQLKNPTLRALELHTLGRNTHKKNSLADSTAASPTLSLNAHRLVISVGLWRISSCLPR